MFDIGFSELLVIFVIGLLVLGPERLPAAVRTGSLWLGRLRRSFNSLRAEIERELNAEEIKRQLHNESVMETFKDAREGLDKGVNATREQLKNLEYDISDVIKPPREDASKTEGDPAPAAQDEQDEKALARPPIGKDSKDSGSDGR